MAETPDLRWGTLDRALALVSPRAAARRYAARVALGNMRTAPRGGFGVGPEERRLRLLAWQRRRARRLDLRDAPLARSFGAKRCCSSSSARSQRWWRWRPVLARKATSPNVFWVPLADVDLSEGAPIRKLPVAGGIIHSGNAAKSFIEAEPFTFMLVEMN